MTAEQFSQHLAAQRASLAALEAEANALKAERDAFLEEHRVVYDTERAYAVKIKALQEQAGPIAQMFKDLRKGSGA